MSRAVSLFLDVSRWISAFAVMLGHSAFISLPDIMTAPHGPLVYVWWFVTRFWHQAVVVFFVISGFLVGGAVLRLARGTRPFLRDYMIDRVSRIYVVFVPALALGFLVDAAGRHLFAGTGLYENPAWRDAFAPIRLLGALAQLQSIWIGQIGANTPLWSLACEFWYYVVFPLLLAPLFRFYSPAARAVSFLCGVILLIFFSIPESYFLRGFGIWILGAFARQAPRPLIGSKWLALAIFLATASAIRLAVRGPVLETYPQLETLADAATAATFANLLLTLRFSTGDGFAFCRLPFNHALSDFSYSLYAIHGPLAIFLLAGARFELGMGWLESPPTAAHWAVQFALLATLVVVAYGFSTVTEAKTAAVRAMLRRLLTGAHRETAGRPEAASRLDLERR
jgi:peptidoglycan/LPS O-acetylase OafA/YrhL